jgi:NADH-ubiquinone oxidoreductase chain 2
MVLIGVLTMILAIAYSSLKSSSLLKGPSIKDRGETGSETISALRYSDSEGIWVNRMAIIILLFAAALSYNGLSTECVGSGVGIFSGLYQVTTISQGMDLFIYLVAALVLFMSEKLFSDNEDKRNLRSLPEYSLIVLFTVLGMSSLISSSDLITMFLSIELQSFAVYILATIYRDSESATSAGLKYFLLGSLSSALILLGSGLLYGFTGLTSFSGLYMLCSTYLNTGLEGSAHGLILPTGGSIFNIHTIEVGILLIGIGLLFKVAAAPFHNWAPDVYDGVPTLVTGWLATMPKISLLVFILEFQGFTQLGNWLSWTYLLLISSLLSLIIGTVGGLSQYRIKRLLTFSTISHVGFLLLALAINTEESVESFLFYLIQYTLTNVNVFFILIAFGYLIHSRGTTPYSPIQYINQLRGQLQANPLLGLSFAICLFSMAGIPPLVGFFGKQMVLYSAVHNGNFFLAIVAILTSVISAAYYLRVIKTIHFDSLTDENGQIIESDSKESNLPESSSLIIATLTLFIIFFILNPTPLLNSVHLLTLSLFSY